MKLTKFQKRVRDLMDSGMQVSRHIADAHDNYEKCWAELCKRRSLDDRLVGILTRMSHGCLDKDCLAHGAYDPADGRLARNIVSSGRLLPTPAEPVRGIVDLTDFLTKKEACVLLMALRYGANEPSDVDFDTFKSLQDKFSPFWTSSVTHYQQ